jgi:hypothetical protein
MAKIRIEATPVPGLIEAVYAPGEYDYHYISKRLDGYLSSPNVAGSAAEKEIRQAVGGQTDAIMVDAKSTHWLSTFFHPAKETKVDQQSQQIPVTAYAITLPSVVGAKATLNISRDLATEVSATFTIFGVGGGSDWKVDIKEQINRDATENESVVVYVPAVFDIMERVQQDGQVMRYPRLTSVTSGESDLQFLPASAIQPEPTWRLTGTHVFDQRLTKAGLTTFSLEIPRSTALQLSPKLTLAQLGLEFGVQITGTYSTDVTMSCAIPDGALYKVRLASGPPSPPVFIWEVQAAN